MEIKNLVWGMLYIWGRIEKRKILKTIEERKGLTSEVVQRFRLEKGGGISEDDLELCSTLTSGRFIW